MLIFAPAMVYAALTDLTTMTIRNGLVLLLIVAYAVLAPFAGLSLSQIGLSVGVAAGILLLGIVCFARGWIGGGDAKLAAATALWLGADYAPAYLINVALFGGVLTLLILQLRAVLLPIWLMKQPWIARLHAKETGVPYGVAMAAAALAVFPQTPWMTVLF